MSKHGNYWEQQAVLRQQIIQAERRKRLHLEEQVEELEKAVKILRRQIADAGLAA